MGFDAMQTDGKLMAMALLVYLEVGVTWQWLPVEQE
jgi:hypothetical protein